MALDAQNLQLTPQEMEFIESGAMRNMSGMAANKAIYGLNSTVTGCLRPGAMPFALALNDTCNQGFFCPNVTNESPPQYCPPEETCQVRRMNRGDCPPQGYQEPVVCTAGFYCPPGGKQRIECAKGYFCPKGSFEPIKCEIGAICPAKSQRQIVTLPFAFMLGIDLLLAIVVGIGFVMLKRNRGKKKYEAFAKPGDGDDIELIQKSQVANPNDQEDDIHSNPSFQAFINSMARCIKTKEVGLSFEFDDLQFEPKKGKRILQGVSGTITSGSMWAVMGGSGAGKSTFVNVLMGKTKHTSGEIKVNGYKKDMSKYKKLIGYVPQDDIVLPELTVRENILHSARIRLPSNWKEKQIQVHVDSLISCLGLSHVEHSRVGDATRPVISGGQRKRVSIGVELAAAPMAIFLDEPTSGLDASSSASIMRLLKAVSRLGVTTITIIHQPREQIFNGFDNLLLLGNGREIYAGPTLQAPIYFNNIGFTFPERENPADVIIDIITGNGQRYTSHTGWSSDPVNKLIAEWDTHQHSPQILYGSQVSPHHLGSTFPTIAPRPISGRPMSIMSSPDQEMSLRRTMQQRGASWPAQVYYCWRRGMTQQVRNASGFFFEIGVGALTGGIIGLSSFSLKGELFKGIYNIPFTILSSAVDYQSVAQIGLLGAMAIGLAASPSGVRVFGEEKLVFWREAAAGQSKSAYYVGKVLSTFIRIALSSLHFTVFFGILATPRISTTEMYGINFLYFYNIYGLSSVIGMFVKREDGPLLAVLASLIIGVLGGVAPPLSKVKEWRLEWLWRASPGVYFAEAYFSQNVLPLEHLYMLDVASRAVGFTLGRFRLDALVLLLIGTIYRVIAYLALIFMNRFHGK